MQTARLDTLSSSNPPMKKIFTPIALMAVLLSGCYHAKITTGLPASAETIDIPWAHSFIAGLVPPNTVDATSKCTNGVAMVETQMSFMNGLASALTSGLYTPLHITVTCASASRTAVPQGANIMKIDSNADAATINKLVIEAASLSASLDSPIYIVKE